MSLEKPSYRDNLERIKEFYPEKEFLRIFEAAKFLGISTRTVKKLFEFKNGYISVAKLAREMS